MKAYLTRIVHFCAAHRYDRPDWTEEKNREVFGACYNEPGHGHNYECTVTVAGEVDPATSMVMPLTELDSLLKTRIVDRFDHDNINTVAPEEFGPGKSIPTAEALAAHIWRDIESRLPEDVELENVRVSEDATLYSEYRGE